MTKERTRIYKWYLILSIVYSSISILTGIGFFIPELMRLVTLIWAPIILIWFVFSITILTVFITKNIEKVALWLPILYLFDQIFSVIVGVIVGTLAISKGIDAAIMLQNPIVFILSELFPVIILVIAIKLILRK